MTTETATAQDQRAGRTLPEVFREANRFRLILGAIVLCQMVWLGALMSRGWYYQADFSNLAEGAEHTLSWSYLTLPQGGHPAVPSRLVFWCLGHAVPLNYGLTVVLRLAAQAAATVLLARLLVLLVGRRNGSLVVVALYAFSPLLIQGTLWLSPSLGLLPAQLLLLAALHSHVRYAVTGRFRSAVATAAYLVGATLFADQAAITALIFPILTLCFLTEGSASVRVRATLSHWREWALIALPLLAFATYYLFGSGNYAASARSLDVRDGLSLIRTAWSSALAPSLSGAQFTWFNPPDSYLGFAFPDVLVRYGALFAVAVMILVGIRRIGVRAILAWAMPFLVCAVGIVIAGIGRFEAYGLIIAHRTEYTYFAAVPAVLSAGLSLWFTDVGAIRARFAGQPEPTSTGTRQARRRRRKGKAVSALGLIAGVLVLGGSVVSGVRYTRQWARSPARDYVNAFTSSASAIGPSINLFDTPIDPRVVPILEPAHYISDLVELTGTSARFDQLTPAPRVVAPDGRIMPASFLPSARVETRGENKFCNYLVSGRTDRTSPLTSTPHENEWFLQLTFFQQHPSALEVTLVDARGQEIGPSSARVVLATNLGTAYLRFPTVRPVAVRIRSTSTATNVCLTSIQVGYPFPKAGS